MKHFLGFALVVGVLMIGSTSFAAQSCNDDNMDWAKSQCGGSVSSCTQSVNSTGGTTINATCASGKKVSTTNRKKTRSEEKKKR
jgi:hypothetical protein